MRFWLSDDSTTLDLGDNVHTISLGGNNRNFNVVEFANSNGGYLRGVGNYSPKKFTFTRDDYITTSAEQHPFNSQRNTFMKWFTRSFTTYVYLNMAYSTDLITLRTKVYPTKLPEDEFANNWVRDFGREFEVISPSGIWETTTQITTSVTISSSNEQEITITNNGVIECAPIFSFTPSTGCSVFQVKMADNFGFRLEATFSSGVQISYYMNTGILTIGGAEVDVSNYLILGSPFLFPAKTTSIFVTACNGVFEYSFPLRYI